MARKLYFLIWISSAAAIGFLVFMPNHMGQDIYISLFPGNFYIAHSSLIQALAHKGFFFFNSLFLFLFFNTYPQIGETGKFMAVFVWVALLAVGSEVGQMYLLPGDYNRSGLNLRDAIADFGGFFLAWLFYLFFVKLIYGSKRLKHNK